MDLDNDSELEAYLIVVPIWIEADPDMPAAVTDVEPIAQAMIGGGHMPRGATFRLSPGLYQADELFLEYVNEARNLNRSIVRHGDIASLMARNSDDHPDRIEERAQGGGLRFLVGTLLHDRHVEPDAQTWLLSITNPQYWPDFEAWQAPVIAAINEHLPPSTRAAWVRPPGPYLRAIASAEEAVDLEELAEADEVG